MVSKVKNLAASTANRSCFTGYIFTNIINDKISVLFVILGAGFSSSIPFCV